MSYRINPTDADYIAAQALANRWVLIAPDGRAFVHANALILGVVCERESLLVGSMGSGDFHLSASPAVPE
jgi:hypothetical protein